MAHSPGIEWEHFLDVSQPDHCGDGGRADGCTHVMRMVEALKYYPTVYPVQNNETWDDLVVFLNDTYASFLEDYQHIMEHHHGQRDRAFLKRQVRRIQCIEENCLKKHLLEVRGSGAELHHFSIDQENLMTFYQDLVDAVHVLFKHGHDIGIRIKMNMDDDETIVSPRYSSDDDEYEFVGRMLCGVQNVSVFCTPNCVTRNWNMGDEESGSESENLSENDSDYMTDID